MKCDYSSYLLLPIKRNPYLHAVQLYFSTIFHTYYLTYYVRYTTILYSILFTSLLDPHTFTLGIGGKISAVFIDSVRIVGPPICLSVSDIARKLRSLNAKKELFGELHFRFSGKFIPIFPSRMNASKYPWKKESERCSQMHHMRQLQTSSKMQKVKDKKML